MVRLAVGACPVQTPAIAEAANAICAILATFTGTFEIPVFEILEVIIIVQLPFSDMLRKRLLNSPYCHSPLGFVTGDFLSISAKLGPLTPRPIPVDPAPHCGVGRLVLQDGGQAVWTHVVVDRKS